MWLTKRPVSIDLEREVIFPGKCIILDTGCGEDVLHQVLVDPGVSLQPLAADPNDLRPVQQAHLQLKRHGYLPKVTPGLTLQGISKRRAQKTTKETLGSDQRLGQSERGISCAFLPFLCEIDIFLWQDGEDLVKDLVWVGLTSQSNVVLRLVGKTDT